MVKHYLWYKNSRPRSMQVVLENTCDARHNPAADVRQGVSVPVRATDPIRLARVCVLLVTAVQPIIPYRT